MSTPLKSLLQALTGPLSRPAWRALLALLLLVITWLALVPEPPRGVSTGWDKSNHALAFASLAFAAVWALWREPRQWPRLVAWLLAYGVGIEIAQYFDPPRSADWHDVVADGVGIALGLLACWPVRRLVTP